MTTLNIRAPEGGVSSVPLTHQRIRVGRSDGCDVVLRDDAEVSREHAEIVLDHHGRVVVRDLGSKNGTRVDGGEVFRSSSRIAHFAIRIGEHEIKIVGAPTPDGAAGPVQFSPEYDSEAGETQFFPSTRGLDLNQQRLELLIQLTERIGGVFDRKQLLEEAVDACCGALNFERGLIALKTHRGDTELPVTRNVQRDETGAFKVSRTLINRALVHGERAIVNNPATDLAGNLTESLVRFPICSALCVPILYRGEIYGVIYGDRTTQGASYLPGDVDFLAAIAQQVGVGLANLRLFQQHVQMERFQAELDQARRIQRRLLPDRATQKDRIVIEGYNEASSTVSGDYFDFFELGDGRLGLIIADVAGHGLSASLIMANVQSAVRVALGADVALPDLADRLNKLIYRNTASNVFVTAVLGTLDTSTGALEYIGAGHPGPLILTRSGVEVRDDRNSLPFGVEAEEAYEVMRIDPGPDELALLFYTDGVVEAANAQGAVLGLEPVRGALACLPDFAPGRLISAALEVVRKHVGELPTADDMTLLAVQVKAAPRP